MNIKEYKKKIKEIGFEEYPIIMVPGQPSLRDFIDYDETGIDLKIYLAKLIISDSFPATGGIAWPANPDWFITNFLRTYNGDLMRIWLTSAIREASLMILAEGQEVFTKGIIGTTFMFGIIEFYAKFKLGFRPHEYDFFDENKKNYIKPLYSKPPKHLYELSIGKAFTFLQEKNLPISRSLNELDTFTARRLQLFDIEEKRYTNIKIADRITLARNAMLHGEAHYFYDIGEYLVMLYILFYFHDIQEQQTIT